MKNEITTPQLDQNSIHIFTDGSCPDNPGEGGWGYIGVSVDEHGDQTTKERSGHIEKTTNQRAELIAVITALTETNPTTSITISSDSEYVVKGCNEWLANWKRKNWKGSNRKPVKNIDLWKLLDALLASHNPKMVWVRGHDGNEFNERADELAGSAAAGFPINDPK